jgi:DNA transformation protein
MPVAAATREQVGDLFGRLGQVRVRAMFGGAGLYCGSVMFGLIAEGEIYLKADGALAEAYAAAGSAPFVHHGRGRPIRMSYWRLPDAALDDPEMALAWGRRSLDAARAARG